MVVDNGATEIEAPVPAGVPPHVPEYQFQVAPAERVPVNESVEVPAEHKKDGEEFEAEGDDGVGLTVIVVLLQFE